MRLIRKYEFNSEAEANAAIDILRDEKGNITESIVKLGYIVKTPATYDNEEEITPAVVSDKYAVDVYWKERPNEQWQQYLVWPVPLGVHSFGSSSAQREYETAYCVLFPNSEYCNPPIIEDTWQE